MKKPDGMTTPLHDVAETYGLNNLWVALRVDVRGRRPGAVRPAIQGELARTHFARRLLDLWPRYFVGPTHGPVVLERHLIPDQGSGRDVLQVGAFFEELIEQRSQRVAHVLPQTLWGLDLVQNDVLPET